MSRASGALATLAALVVLAGCIDRTPEHVVSSRSSPDRRYTAEVRLERCGPEWCHSLWAGPAGGAARLETLPHASGRSDEIAWARDGRRVAFLVNGHQLRLYDPESRAPAGLLDLVPADGPPTTRVARGVTFSDNGAAVTFDDCPRDRSGCRPGIVAIR